MENNGSYINLQEQGGVLSEIVQYDLIKEKNSNVLFRLVVMPSIHQKFYCVKMIDGEQTIHRHYPSSDEGLEKATEFYEGLKCQ